MKLPFRKSSDTPAFKILRDSILWLLITVILIIVSHYIYSFVLYQVLAFWVALLPFGYIVYLLNLHWLIPLYERKKKVLTYLLLLLMVGIMVAIPFFVPYASRFMITSRSVIGKNGVIVREEVHSTVKSGLIIFSLLWVSDLTISTMLAWTVFRRNQANMNHILSLKTKLGKTSTDLQFLRSQINPHFLFNVLNTLYSTSLQEKSERTAQGIQKLGDMMRFMLHENLKDKIHLSQEVDYLRQYIDLQLLRIESSPEIKIETDINDSLCDHQIAPMLVIPFVENAFKHGISLTNKSWIKIALHCDTEKLYLDAYNSIHPASPARASDADPEKEHSGIGLENVKQRLSLLYPEKHELLIRKTDQEYVIHLTVRFT